MGADARTAYACLAVLARRAGTPLVISYEELVAEGDNDTRVDFAFDDGAECVRVSVPEKRT